MARTRHYAAAGKLGDRETCQHRLCSQPNGWGPTNSRAQIDQALWGMGVAAGHAVSAPGENQSLPHPDRRGRSSRLLPAAVLGLGKRHADPWGTVEGDRLLPYRGPARTPTGGLTAARFALSERLEDAGAAARPITGVG